MQSVCGMLALSCLFIFTIFFFQMQVWQKIRVQKMRPSPHHHKKAPLPKTRGGSLLKREVSFLNVFMRNMRNLIHTFYRQNKINKHKPIMTKVIYGICVCKILTGHEISHLYILNKMHISMAALLAIMVQK